ncbi:MAG TPA: hypothetical protein VFE18_15370, partial [Phenylobacterium sp.]|uniref:hypothetical protein n=1 Tax=Phenylobacterium sp. TaxID=1871053 RepID=UPI002D3837D0
MRPAPSEAWRLLFGGPVPLTSPEGNVVGYYDHQAAKAGLGLIAEDSEVAPLFQPGGWMDGLLENGSTRISALPRRRDEVSWTCEFGVFLVAKSWLSLIDDLIDGK